MFSGLIAYAGRVTSIDALPGAGATLHVRCEGVEVELPSVKDSICINGVCLTATRIEGSDIGFDVIPETMARTSFAEVRVGDIANVEYSLRIGDRLGGHFVYGHVDAAARVLERTAEGQGDRVRIERPEPAGGMIAEKAFIAVDGVSVTVAATGTQWFEIALIPETLRRTTLGRRPRGSFVNVEIDPLARYAFAAVKTLR